MHDKFDKLLPELIPLIGQNSPTPTFLNFASTSKHYFSLFQPMMDVRKFLYYVVRREDHLVQAMLKDNVNLLVERGTVTDYSGRTFFNVSAFEYALWALDKHLWEMMLEMVFDAKKIMPELLTQYNHVKNNGISYELHGEFFKESHFDFKNTIIKALQSQTNFFNGDKKINWSRANQQWQQGVGRAQRLLPMHVVHEYCCNTLFYPAVGFTDKPPGSMTFYNQLTKKVENWYHKDSKLGDDFAILKGWKQCHVEGGECTKRSKRGFWYDLKAMKALSGFRSKDFMALELTLSNLPTIQNVRGAMYQSQTVSSSN